MSFTFKILVEKHKKHNGQKFNDALKGERLKVFVPTCEGLKKQRKHKKKYSLQAQDSHAVIGLK